MKELSIQSDVEMLSIEVMETYAKQKHIPSDEVINLFHKNHIFEKIMLQHEYLHQVSFDC